MNRILVIRGGAIGDFVLTLPAIKLLRDRFPWAHLEILGYRHIIALAENRFYAQAVRSIDYGPLARFFARNAELSPELIAYFRSFDLVVSYLFDPDLLFEQNVRRCGVQEFLAGSPKFTNDQHAARQLAQPLAQLDLSLADPAARLYPSAEDRDFARTFLQEPAGPLLAIHPGSGSKTKNWPAEKWIELLEWSFESGQAASLVVVGGEADEKELTKLRTALSGKKIHFAQNLPLPHLAAVLESCALYLGHDTGISHIAAAVGTKCVLLFGPTDPAVWAPANANVRVVRALDGRMEDLPLEEVLHAARHALTD